MTEETSKDANGEELAPESPEVVLFTLRMVEAMSRADQPAVLQVIQDAFEQARPAVVMLSLIALAEGLMKTLPGWEARLQEWMLACEVESVSDTPD
jgi:hypothetical protein